MAKGRVGVESPARIDVDEEKMPIGGHDEPRSEALAQGR